MSCDFHKFALELYNLDKNTTDQARIRTCISRLYYSIYHKVNNWLSNNYSKQMNMFECGTHVKLQYCLKEIGREKKNLKFSKLSDKLKALHGKRCIADYELKNNQSTKAVELMILEIEQTLVLIDELIA